MKMMFGFRNCWLILSDFWGRNMYSSLWIVIVIARRNAQTQERHEGYLLGTICLRYGIHFSISKLVLFSIEVVQGVLGELRVLNAIPNPFNRMK
jgi:hypothetical protein